VYWTTQTLVFGRHSLLNTHWSSCTMDHLTVLASVFAIHLLATISPGPNFAVVTHAALNQSRETGIVAAVGVAAGSLAWAAAAFLGLAVVLAKFAWLYGALKLAGGLYLAYSGFRLWRLSRAPLSPPSGTSSVRHTPWQAFRLGFLTNMANPKSVIFFGAIFAALLTPALPAWVPLVAMLIVFANALLWYVAVAYFFSAQHTRTHYQRLKGRIDKLVGAVLMLMGVRLMMPTR